MTIPEAQPIGAQSNVKGISAENEPWVFAKDVAQCFFIKDPTRPGRVVVRRGKRSIIGLDEVETEEDFHQFDDPKEEDDFNEPYTTRRSRTTLPSSKKFNPFIRSTTTNKRKKTVKKKCL